MNKLYAAKLEPLLLRQALDDGLPETSQLELRRLGQMA